jgi:hypothetical protein
VEERLARYADLVQRLPPANRAALAALVRLLVAAAPAELRLAAFASVLCPGPSPSPADDVDVDLHLKSCVALCADLVAHSARLFPASDARDEAPAANSGGGGAEEWSWRVVEEPSPEVSSSGRQMRMALSVVVSHGLGGTARARLYATRSPDEKVPLLPLLPMPTHTRVLMHSLTFHRTRHARQVVLRLQNAEGDVDLDSGLLA